MFPECSTPFQCNLIVIIIWTDGRTDRQTDEWTDGQTNGQTNGRTDKQTDGRTDGRMDTFPDSIKIKFYIINHLKSPKNHLICNIVNYQYHSVSCIG